ncbi:restriction endonuclease subunit S [Pseudomonas synxantha]|nr:restriction endonuclease subunit S [Pseudomonas synxantha]
MLTNSAEFGVVNQRDFFDKDIATQGKLEGYFVVELGSYVYNPRISSTAPVGPISKNKIGTGVMSPLYTVFKFKEKRNDFYEHFFKTTGWHAYMRQTSSTGARHDRMAISNDGFMAMPLPVSSPDEQQKIADCLNSLDELIVAQHCKVDALKKHKKGLMQQLFPRKSETHPRLRLPEFQNAGEWKSAPLGQLLTSSPDYGVNAAAVPFSELLPKYLRITDISEDGRYCSDKKVSVDIKPTAGSYLDEGDIALVRTGASVGKSYCYRKEDGRLVFAGFLIRIKPAKKKLVSAYLANFLTTDIYWDWVAVTSTRSGQPGINSTEYSSLSIPLPPGDLSEQQRITDCLTSLDDLITAQIQKYEALKTHKKGLMQQLFPATEEVKS